MVRTCIDQLPVTFVTVCVQLIIICVNNNLFGSKYSKMPVLIRVGIRLLKRNYVNVSSQRDMSSILFRHGQILTLAPISNLNMCTRDINTQEITKNIQLISNEKIKIDKSSKDLKLSNELDRPLVVLLTWLMAKQKHILKYSNLYIKQGFDVLNVSVTPWELLWPVKGVQPVARDVITFLQNNSACSPVLLHGFSVGGYVWGECLVHMSNNIKLYEPVIQRIAGQVWDSTVDLSEIQIGTPKAVFPRNKVLRNALQKYMLYHLKKFHEPATRHYIRASQLFHSPLVRAPTLFFLSNADPIGTVSANQRARESMEGLGIKCYFKCWDGTPHVGHFQRYPKEYTQELYNFMDTLGLLNYHEKLRVEQ